MKSFSILILFAFFMAGFFSCSNPVKEDLLVYVNNDLPGIAKEEAAAIASYESVTGSNYKDDLTAYLVIRDSVIPNYKKYKEDLELISSNLKTDEVKKLHESYIEVANTQYSAFTLMLSALEHHDYSVLSQVNEKMDKAHKLLREWQSDLKNLCEKNNVVLNKPLAGAHL